MPYTRFLHLPALCCVALLGACASAPLPPTGTLAAPAVGAPSARVATANVSCSTENRAAEAQRWLAPLDAPQLYVDVVYGDHQRLGSRVQAGALSLRVAQQSDDAASGLSTTTLLTDDGHAVLVLQGMNRWFMDRGGVGDALSDLGAVLAGADDQWQSAERQYLALACNPAITSVEVVGYSLGSQSASVLAARHGAQATVFGDMGAPRALFAGLGAHQAQAMRSALRERVVSLRLSGDVAVRLFGAGDVVGQVIDLPQGVAGVFHAPEVYRNSAELLLHEQHAATHGTPVVLRE